MAFPLELRPRRRIDAMLLDELEEGFDQDGLDVVIRVPHHPVAYLRPALYLVLAALLPVYLLVSNGPLEPLLLSVILGLRGGWLFLRVYEDWFVITDMRIFRVWGVLNQQSGAMSLSRIVDFAMEKPLLGHFLKYGHFVFENAAQDQGLREIRYVPHVDDLDRTIQRRVFDAGGGPAKHKKPKAAQVVAVGAPSTASGAGMGQDPDLTGEIPVVPAHPDED